MSKADEEERYKSLKAAAKLAKNPATFWTFALKNRMSEKYRLVLHTAARLRFVEENGLAHSDFDFARYLACRLGHALGELVEVPAGEEIKLQAPFNRGSLVVCVRCGSLHAVECIPRRSCPSLGLSEGRGAEIARQPDSLVDFHTGPCPDLDPARSRVVVLLAGRRPSGTEHAVIFVVVDGLRDVHRDVRDSREATVDTPRLLRALRGSGRGHDASARCGGGEGSPWS